MNRNIYNILHFNLLVLLILMISPNNSIMAQQLSPEQVVQNNLDFYNKRHIDGFMSYFRDDVTIVNFSDSKIIAKDSKEVRKIYDDMFKISPNLHSTIVKRIVLGNKVIDHESIIGRNGSMEILELVLIYEVADDKIFKITVLRK